MKTLWFIFLFCGITLISCKKNTAANSSYGIITGPDLAVCVCCGGSFIIIGESTYRIESVPANSGIDINNGPFPIYVELTYNIDPKCNGRFINSSDIHRR